MFQIHHGTIQQFMVCEEQFDMHIMWHQMGKIFMPTEYNPLWSVVPLLTWFNFDPSMQNLSRIIQSHFRQLRDFPYPSYSPRTREGSVARQVSRSGQSAESGAKISWMTYFFGTFSSRLGACSVCAWPLVVITCSDKYGIELLIHCQTSTVQLLKFWNG